jgi:hypothetical protein
MNRPELLGIYLNDHLAGAAGGVETARRTRGANEGTEFGAPLARICDEIESDRESLQTVMKELGIGQSRWKPAIGWLGEKVGRLKLNGQLRGYSPLSRLLELEVLLMGITGKMRLWTLLDELVGEESKTDFKALAAGAEDQRARVADLQLRAARLL